MTEPIEKEAHDTERSKAGGGYEDYGGTDEDRLRQEQEIEDIINKRPPVGPREDFESLKEELKDNFAFSRKMPDLERKYNAMRRIRGDGSCFFRGFIFSLMEGLVHQRKKGETREFQRVKNLIGSSLDFLVQKNYERSQIDLFCEFASEMFEEKKFPKSLLELEEYFADPEESMYLVWFCRLLCAGYIKHDWDNRFCFFVTENYASADDYCAREVEPTNKECEQLQIIALCEYFEVRISVEYLDASDHSDTTTSHFFGPEEKPVTINLLYRPGHYDVLYSRS